MPKASAAERMTSEDTFAYLVVLFVVGRIYDLLPSAVTTGQVWRILWLSVAIVGLVIVPMAWTVVLVRKYLRLNRQ